MNRIACVAGLMAVLSLNAEAKASFPLGAFALVEKVVFEPNDVSPERIQIWGAFALAKDRTGNKYGPPVRGYMYFRLDEGNAGGCKAEWADLKKMADTGKWVAFGSTEHLDARVRKASEKPKEPDAYYADNLGVQNVAGKQPRRVNKEAVKSLLALPAPVAPADDDLVPPGEVTLVTRNILDKEHARATYVFEIESASGDKEVSPEVPAGDKETKWSPKKPLKAGETYQWRVRATDGKWKGPVASCSFKVKS